MKQPFTTGDKAVQDRHREMAVGHVFKVVNYVQARHSGLLDFIEAASTTYATRAA